MKCFKCGTLMKPARLVDVHPLQSIRRYIVAHCPKDPRHTIADKALLEKVRAYVAGKQLCDEFVEEARSAMTAMRKDMKNLFRSKKRRKKRVKK